MVYYVNCSGGAGQKEREFSSINDAEVYYEKCKSENEWYHIEITKQVKVYLPLDKKEFN